MKDRVPPKAYTIARERPFLATLADGLVGLTGGDPMRLPRITILLPTPRSTRLARRLSASGARPREAGTLLLPHMLPIGDVDLDELTLAERSAYGDALRVPPLIPSGLGRFEPSGPEVISASISVGRLMEFLTILGQDVEVTLKPAASTRTAKAYVTCRSTRLNRTSPRPFRGDVPLNLMSRARG